MKRGTRQTLLAVLLGCAVALFAAVAAAQPEPTPLEFLKAREWANRETRGEIYLGKVLSVLYGPYSSEVSASYHPFILELTDVLKTPLRSNYRLVLKGFTDTSGNAEANVKLSRKRAEDLRKTIVDKYYFEGDRITVKAYGSAEPVASNETPEGRSQNRRVEIHVYGDVSEAVRFVTPEENQ
jgi:OOP family OmpA-OmpF porin